MDIQVIAGDVVQHATEVTVLLCAHGVELPRPLDDLVEADDFDAAADECLVLYPRGLVPATRLVLVGLGPVDDVDAERIRRAAAVGIRAARPFGQPNVALGFHGLAPTGAGLGPESVGEAVAVGLGLGAYRYLRHKTGLGDDERFEIASVTILVDAGVDAVTDGVHAGSVVARAVNLARDLVNTPGAMKTPPMLAQRAVELGERHPAIAVTVLDEVELAAQGFGGILAVGNGSDSPPRFIIMEYGSHLTDVPTVCVVGKGLTFDSGGLNIKPEDGMLNMKNDMGGSAAVFGVMQAVAELQLPVHVVGLVPSAENMPSGRSYRPGDVVTTLSGTTVEILNTDAEGRVILSDGLHYAQRYEPDAIVELSTLTGAVIVALGNVATGVMATDQALADSIVAAGDASGDRGWQLPLWQEYRDLVKGDVGDLKNLAGRPAGSITAGAFLAAFTGDRPFVHLDIAGTAWIDAPTKPYQVRGATGAGVQMVTEYLRRLDR
jgi:leucyl aminopeptidase